MGYSPGFGFGGIFFAVLNVAAIFVVFAVVVGLLFLLVRFLIVGTRAAQLYIERNGATPDASTPTSAAPPTYTDTNPNSDTDTDTDTAPDSDAVTEVMPSTTTTGPAATAASPAPKARRNAPAPAIAERSETTGPKAPRARPKATANPTAKSTPKAAPKTTPVVDPSSPKPVDTADPADETAS